MVYIRHFRKVGKLFMVGCIRACTMVEKACFLLALHIIRESTKYDLYNALSLIVISNN
jgi:hypothetical protein